MKASDYYDMYLSSDETPNKHGIKMDTVRKILFEMVVEVRTIGESRKCKSPDSLAAIFREQHEKFLAFHRLLNNPVLRKDSIFVVVATDLPETWDVLKSRLMRYVDEDFQQNIRKKEQG